MKKLALIGVLVAGLAVPATTSAAVRGHAAQARTKRICVARTLPCQRPIFRFDRNWTTQGPTVFAQTVTVWVRDSNGELAAVPGGNWRADG